MSEQDTNRTSAVIAHPYYQTAQAQITEPTRFVAISHYFRRRWLRLMGPVGTAILLELRGRCYNNPATGERRDIVVAAQRELADAIGISVDTLQRQLGKAGRGDDPKANSVLRRFVWTQERYERSGAGRVRQLENVYHVSMDDPVHPDDEERLEALVEELARQANETEVRQQQGRKLIIPAGEQNASRSTASPKPQNAALRPEEPCPPDHKPQNAVGPCRILRQGLPQNAALSEDSLLFFNGEFTSPTLNVTEESNFVVSEQARPAEQAGLRREKPGGQPERDRAEATRNLLSEAIDREVAALVEELHDMGSERRHRQLLSVCEQHGLHSLPQQALQATRQRLANEKRQGALEKPGAYYQRILVTLLEHRQVFVPTLAERDEDDPQEVRRLIQKSLGGSQEIQGGAG